MKYNEKQREILRLRNAVRMPVKEKKEEPYYPVIIEYGYYIVESKMNNQ